MSVKPITPEEVVAKKLNNIPDEVIEAFNEMIAKEWSAGSACFKQEEVITLIISKGISRANISKNKWLDVEDIFRKSGWIVEYDKPDYNEPGDSSFTFKRN